MHFVIAVRAFFATLFHGATAEAVRAILDGKRESPAEASPVPPLPGGVAVEARPRPAVRSEALTLLAALQREARFVDLVQEPLTGYGDAQVGAAARDVLRDCQKVLERFFGLQPVSSVGEGELLALPSGYDAETYRVGGAVPPAGEPVTGTVVHPGWRATRCELPSWGGGPEAIRVIAPAELEVSAS